MSNSYNLRSTSPNLPEDPQIRQIGYQDINSRRLARQTARNRASSFTDSSTTSFFNNLQLPTQTSLPDSPPVFPPSGLPPQSEPSASAAFTGSIQFRSQILQLIHLESKFFTFKVSDLLTQFNRLSSWNGSLLTFYSQVHLPLTLLAESYDMLDALLGITIFLPPHGQSTYVDTMYGKDFVTISGTPVPTHMPPDVGNPATWFNPTHAYITDPSRYANYRAFMANLKGTLLELIIKCPELSTCASDARNDPSAVSIYAQIYRMYT